MDVPKDTHGNLEAANVMVQQAMGDRYWLHIDPSCHINSCLVHGDHTWKKQVNTGVLYECVIGLSVTPTSVDITTSADFCGATKGSFALSK